MSLFGFMEVIHCRLNVNPVRSCSEFET
ncbi:hypothetical protein A2U01_0108136, partial [Trifolium medium]|nr:hypothetical protein [Trifolium medium]